MVSRQYYSAELCVFEVKDQSIEIYGQTRSNEYCPTLHFLVKSYFLDQSSTESLEF